MAVPTTISDLSTTAASNSPAGSDLPSTVDDVLRAVQAIVRTEYNTQQTANATYATLTGSQTLTNKTLTAPTINGGTITGITDLAVADGGTGASTAADARTNLGVDAAGTTATHAALTATHGVSGAIVGTTDAQTLTNKTLVVANNTVTTAASGSLTATELNAALAQLETLIAGIGSVNVQTGFVSSDTSTGSGSTVVTTGTGEDLRYVDVTVTAVSGTANCYVIIDGAASNASFGDSVGWNTTSPRRLTARMTSTTNLRVSCAAATSYFQFRWQVIDHGA